MSQAVHDEIARCVIQLLLKEPFFGHLLGSVARAVDDGTPTVAVCPSGGRVTLSVNPAFFTESLRGAPERVAVIKHEALHLVFRHLFRRDPARHHPVVFNLAADLVVNQFVGPPWKLPDDAVTLKTFPDLGLTPDQTLEWYYDRLDALARALDQGGGGSGPRSRSRSRSSKSAQALRRILADPRWHSDHGRWGSGTDADDAVASAALDRAVAQAKDRAGPRGWDALPNPLRELIAAAIERRAPKVDWRRALRIFSQSTRRTRIAGTFQRKSRRYGTVPGIRVKRLQRMAVVVDTSGSIADADLSDFFAEVHAMWRQGAEIVVVECDEAVQRTFEYRGTLPAKVGGRGGTSFDPALRWLRKSARRTGSWDGCVYFTDGAAPAPRVRPPCKLLWVITRDGNAGPHLKGGRAVKLT
jgi:predicted metal-dependent peptidase